ncbi:Leucine-rich repeat (LRR) family protein [Theobroma cacao]|uniref:Leucine-rich repeat (LRR) family protein n=1 Tax=Theobroma cacao TaxID=3641 RepID=A0A061E239_THECC|nr:Leucine-rich repeat (LRR) family protein [Theobroma cacao]
MQILRWVLKVLLICSILEVFPLSLAQTASQAPAVCSEADRAALLGFKAKILKDTTDSLSSWIGRDCCGGDWEGVQCNPAGRVTTLALQRPERDSSLYMKGTLSPSLGSLQFLEVLVISGMKLITGPIPENFSNLTRLTQLVLEDNSLEGNIPSGLGRLYLVQTLSLAGNRFRGPVPPSLGNLRNLVLINFGRNSLTGPIPSSFKSLLRLQSFDLSFNLLSGFIPEFVGQFRNITYIDLSNNHLSGHLPISMFSLVTLSDLSLSHNQLTGIIPDQIGNLKSLTSLSLSSNKFIGHIPASISRLQNLWSLNLSRNGFSDPLPVISSRGIPSLLSIDLSFNNLSLGTVPDWIMHRQLSDVNLAGCKLRGTLPKFTRPDSMSSIDLSDNFLTGSISAFFTNMTSLQKLKLSNNQLKFDLSELAVPDGISSIDLHSNQVFGSLSSILNNRTSSFLEVIDVSNNLISGTMPEFTEGLSLKVLNIGSNKIADQVPSSISNLIELERLDISRNQITGTIPTSLGQLVKLEWLDLSINRLTGKIPTTLLGIHRMRHASFRANRLCGEIPQGRPYNIFPASAYAHNLCLCGKPLPPCRGKK